MIALHRQSDDAYDPLLIHYVVKAVYSNLDNVLDVLAEFFWGPEQEVVPWYLFRKRNTSDSCVTSLSSVITCTQHVLDSPLWKSSSLFKKYPLRYVRLFSSCIGTLRAFCTSSWLRKSSGLRELDLDTFDRLEVRKQIAVGIWLAVCRSWLLFWKGLVDYDYFETSLKTKTWGIGVKAIPWSYDSKKVLQSILAKHPGT